MSSANNVQNPPQSDSLHRPGSAWRVVGRTIYNHDPRSLSLDLRPTPATLTGKWHDNQRALCDEMEKCLKHAPSWTWEIETQKAPLELQAERKEKL
jgi:hypothetical protein